MPPSATDYGVELREIATLKAHPENSLIFNDPEDSDRFGEVLHSIKKFGLWEPICIKDDGTILSGHVRVRVYEKLKLTHIPARTMTFDSYLNEVTFLVRSNTDRRQLTFDELAHAYNRLKTIPREQGGAKGKPGRPEKGAASRGIVSDTRDSAAKALGQGRDRLESLEAVLVNGADVPEELKQAVRDGKVSPTAAAEAVRVERKRQAGDSKSGKIADPAPLKAWTAQKTEPKVEKQPPNTSHEERVASEAKAFEADVAALFELHKQLDRILTRRPLKSVIGPTEHHEYASQIRDVALRAWKEIEEVQGETNAGKQMRLAVISGGRK